MVKYVLIVSQYYHSYVKVDALKYAKNGTLEEMLDEIYKE